MLDARRAAHRHRRCSALIRATANLDVGGGGGRTDGLHVTSLQFGIGTRFDNDYVVGVEELASGIVVNLDAL